MSSQLTRLAHRKNINHDIGKLSVTNIKNTKILASPPPKNQRHKFYRGRAFYMYLLWEYRTAYQTAAGIGFPPPTSSRIVYRTLWGICLLFHGESTLSFLIKEHSSIFSTVTLGYPTHLQPLASLLH